MSRPLPSGRAVKLRTRRSQRLETIGAIIIVLLILAITVTRFWHNVHWGAR